MFNIDDLDDGTERTFSKFADDTKLVGVVDTPDGCAAIHKGINRLEKWADRNLMEFNKGKCKVLFLGRNNCRYRHRLRSNQLESSFAEKALEVLVDIKLNISQQCIRKGFAKGWREVTLPLYLVLVRPHLGCRLQLWALLFRG